MAESPNIEPLQAALSSLTSLGIVPGIADALRSDAARTRQQIYDLVVSEVPAYTDSGNPDVLPELAQHLERHIEEICNLLGGARGTSFDFVGEHADRRAEQKFPLDAIHRGYRSMHGVVSTRVRDAALEVADTDAHVTRVIATVADFVNQYTTATSSRVTSGYVQHTRRLAEAEGNRRTRLLNLLLEGFDESDLQAEKLLRRAGYLQQRQSYCVVLAQSVNPVEMENPPRVRRIIDAIDRAVHGISVRLLAGVRDNLVTVICSDTRRLSGWTAPQTKLADRIEPLLLTLGPAVLVGVSSDQPSTSHIPRGLKEARIALEFSDVTDRVVQFSRLPIRRLLLHLGGDHVKSALPVWTEAFVQANEKARGKLTATLRAYAESDMNVLRAARILDVHPNTIYSRMGRIEEVTGLDGQRFDALNELLLAAELGQ